MNDLTYERNLGDARLRQEAEAAARRERADILKRFLAQSAEALLGRKERDCRDWCPACG